MKNKQIQFTAIALLTANFLLQSTQLFCQSVGVNGSGSVPNVSALLDIDATGMSPKGILIPRIALTSATDAATIATPATSLLIYNPGTGGLSPAGYYYNQGTSGSPNWVPFLTNNVNAPAAWSLTGNTGTTGGPNFIGTTNNISLRFRTNNTQKMIIDSLGNVGIGTTLPSGKLSIVSSRTYGAPGVNYTEATAQITGNADEYPGFNAYASGGTVAWESAEHNTFRARGTMGSPTPTLSGDKVGYMSGRGFNSTLVDYSSIGAIEFTQTGAATANGNPGALQFITNDGTDQWGTERMRIASDGNVGIGTTIPWAKLSIVSTRTYGAPGVTYAESQVGIAGNADEYPSFNSTAYGGTSAWEYPSFSAFRARGTMASPTPTLSGDIVGQVSGRGYNSTLAGFSSVGNIYFAQTGAATASGNPGALEFFTNDGTNQYGTERMRIASDGKVGIGTTSPSAKLTVGDFDTNVEMKVENWSSTAARFPMVSALNFSGGFSIGHPSFYALTYRGNSGAPAAVQNGDALGAFVVGGATGVGYTGSWANVVKAYASENFTATANGTSIQFETIANGATASTPRMYITNAGNVGVGANATPNSTFEVAGSFANTKRTAVSAAYTVLSTDFYIGITAGTGTYTITLPAAAASNAGRIYIIKREIAFTSGVVTVSGNGTNIDGAATATGTLNASFGILRVLSTGTIWVTF